MKLKNVSLNRIIACLIAMFIFAFSMNFSFDANASNTSRTYNIYNATTGAYIDRYTLNALDTENNTSTYSLVGNDDRVVDFTKSGVVKLMTSNYYLGTGFVVSKNIIATAAHCVKNKTISSIRLFDTNGNVSKTVTPVEVHIPKTYVDSNNTNYDYALITVNDDLSDYAIFDLGVALDSAISNHLSVSVTGFPSYLNDNSSEIVNDYTQNSMYTGTGVLNFSTIYNNNNYKLYYTADSSGGNSGGPAYITISKYGKVYYTVVAIHTNGFNESSSEQLNSGTRMTTDLLHFYMHNPNV